MSVCILSIHFGLLYKNITTQPHRPIGRNTGSDDAAAAAVLRLCRYILLVQDSGNVYAI